ncbi:hypothetical protein GCM10020220_064800 [Nonomuraea rubra]
MSETCSEPSWLVVTRYRQRLRRAPLITATKPRAISWAADMSPKFDATLPNRLVAVSSPAVKRPARDGARSRLRARIRHPPGDCHPLCGHGVPAEFLPTDRELGRHDLL